VSLPKGWSETTLGDCQGKTDSLNPRRYPNEAFDLYSVPSYAVHAPDRTTGAEIGSTKQIVREDDVLLCKIVPHIRRAWRVPAHRESRQIASGEWIVLRDHGIEPEFLRSFVLSDVFHEQFMRTVSGVGGSLMRARPADAARIPVPVPPVAEQRRIVAKLDLLTARIARARGELDRVPILAEQFRKQIVCEAFDGSLTADWRVSNADSKIITDDALNEAYLTEAGSPRRKPPAPIEWRPGFALPSSWRWVSIDQVVTQVQYGSSAKTSSDADGIPVLRMGNIQRGRLDWTDLKYLPRDHEEFPDLLLNEGDLLFNRTNSFELVGKTAVCKDLYSLTSFASYLIRIRPFGVLAELLSAYLNSPFARSWIERVVSQQVGQANVNGSKLKALGVPLPPFDEQTEILRRLNNAFARDHRLEAEAARARALLDRLESAIRIDGSRSSAKKR
jgi:type I restriction enzyme S subunit